MTSSWGRRLVASISAAVAVAAIAFVASTFVILVASQLNSAALATTTPYVGWNSLVALVLGFAAALLGAMDRRWIAVVTGIVLALVSTLLGTLILFTVLNVTLSGAAWGQLFQSFIGINLPFWLAVAIAFPTAGYAVYRAIDGGERAERRIALVRIPAANLAEGLTTHIDREPVDTELADKQWDALRRRALRGRLADGRGRQRRPPRRLRLRRGHRRRLRRHRRDHPARRRVASGRARRHRGRAAGPGAAPRAHRGARHARGRRRPQGRLHRLRRPRRPHERRGQCASCARSSRRSATPSSPSR